jgi:flagellar basal body rod protein FlgC
VNDFGVMQYAASGMDAQRSALDVLAHNVQLVQTADRTHPVHPLVPQFAVADDDAADFEQTLSAAFGSSMSGDAGDADDSGGMTGPSLGDAGFADQPTLGSESGMAAVAALPGAGGGVGADGSDGVSAGPFELGDDGGALPGEVRFSGARASKAAVTGIDAVSEMVAVLGAQRAFEADASTFDTGKRLIEKTLAVEQ